MEVEDRGHAAGRRRGPFPRWMTGVGGARWFRGPAARGLPGAIRLTATDGRCGRAARGCSPAPGAPRGGGNSRCRCGTAGSPPPVLSRRDGLRRAGLRGGGRRRSVVLPVGLGPVVAVDPAGLSRGGAGASPYAGGFGAPGSGSLPPSRRTRPPGRCGRARRRRGGRPPRPGIQPARPYPEWAMPFDGARGEHHPGGVGDLRRRRLRRPDRDDGVPGHRRVRLESVGGDVLPAPSAARAFRPGRSTGAPAAAEVDAAAAGGAGEARRLGFPDLRPPPAAAPPAARRGDPPRGEVARRTGSSN